MNYRHAYHAGNFADVLKHATLSLVIEHLKKKTAPFRVIDTHAGIGVYDLASAASQKTGEWRQGIGRIYGHEVPPSIAALLAPYLSTVAAVNTGQALTRYPGSPAIAQHLLRRDDVLIANELHPEDFVKLQTELKGSRNCKALKLDAWSALKSLLPPKERRGIVLIDPPFEEPGEFDRMLKGLTEAHRRFSTGTILLWYPIKDSAAVASFRQRIAATGIAKILNAELIIQPQAGEGVLRGAGLIILNPTYRLDTALETLLVFLANRLPKGQQGRFQLTWLASENVTSP